MINGFGFCSYSCESGTPLYQATIDRVSIKKAIFDEMDMRSLDGTNLNSEIIDNWDFFTIMHCNFLGNVSAGNVGNSFSSTLTLRIKRREVGLNTWITLTDIPISSPRDFNFTMFDKLNRSGVEYEYAIMPVIGSVEGAIVSKFIYSEFDGVCLFDEREMYYSVMDVSVGCKRSQVDTIVKTLGRRYPIYVKSNKSNYSSGDCTAFFLPSKVNGRGFTTQGALKYRDELVDFLTNYNSKIMKDWRGHIWIVQIQGDVENEDGGHPDHVLTKFSWVQIGDATSEEDLRELGFVGMAGD